MTPELKEEIEKDIEASKTMTDMVKSKDVRELVNRLISYKDILIRDIAQRQYEMDIMKGKVKTLDEYIRNGKQFGTELSITNNQDRKLNNY